MTSPQVISESVIEPGTGKAIELLQGQILRVEQIEGGQCADFNCFNLHDYKEFMHCGRTRTVHGFHPTKGSFMWSAPPRERAMLYILEDTVGRNDVLFPRCSAYVYEASYGFAVHTNCHDIQAEAQREYGLTPDDVHDSFNLFMCTGVDADGHAFMTRQTTKPGDHKGFQESNHQDRPPAAARSELYAGVPKYADRGHRAADPALGRGSRDVRGRQAHRHLWR